VVKPSFILSYFSQPLPRFRTLAKHNYSLSEQNAVQRRIYNLEKAECSQSSGKANKPMVVLFKKI